MNKLFNPLMAIQRNVDYVDVPGPDGQVSNMGGSKQIVYYASISDFASIATTPATPGTPEEFVVISDDHTFVTGKCWKKCYCTQEKGSANNDGQGEIDGKSWKQGAKIFIPGADAISLGTVAMMQNDKLIILVETPDGKLLQVGSVDFYAYATGKFSTATNSQGIRGTEVDFVSVQPYPLIYEGVLSLTPAV